MGLRVAPVILRHGMIVVVRTVGVGMLLSAHTDVLAPDVARCVPVYRPFG